MKIIIQTFLILVACESFAASKTYRPTADATVRRSSPNRNYGKESRVGADISARKYGYFRFNVDGITGKVRSAKIRFFVLNKTVDGPKLRLVDGDWQERKVTYKNRPAFTSRAIADSGALAKNRYVEYDVTDTVRSNGKYSHFRFQITVFFCS